MQIGRSQQRIGPLLLLCALGGLFAACNAPPVEVTPGGCRALRPGPTCELMSHKGQLDELRLLVKTSPDARLIVLQGWRSLPTAIEANDRGHLVRVRPRPGVSSLTIIARRGIVWSRQELAVREWTASQWIKDAYETWAYESKPDEARRALEENLNRETPRLDDEAWALGLLARIAIDQNQITKGKQLLERALLADRRANLIADELRDSFRLQDVLIKQEQAFEAADRLMDAVEQGPAKQDESRLSWVKLNRGLVLLGQEKPKEVLPYADEGMKWAERFGDREAVSELRAMSAAALQSMGRTQDANELLKGFVDKEPSPCRKADLLMQQGRVQRVALEGARTAPAALDPSQPLRAALKIYGTPGGAGCPQKRPMLQVLSDLAHVELLRERWTSMQTWLDALRKELGQAGEPELNKELELQLIQLRGQRALKAQRLDEALPLFEELKEKSAQNRMMGAPPVTNSAPLAFNEAHWQALIGIAEVQKYKNDKAHALQTCLQADAYLEQNSLAIPLGVGRGGFLGRHERGSSLCLALFIELGRTAEAFEWLRRVRIRALLPVLGLLRSNLDPAKMATYRDLRRQLDDNVAAEEVAAFNQVPRLRQERTGIYRNLLYSVESLTDQNLLSSPLRFQPLRDGELALICHPALTGGWQCIAASPGEKRAYVVKQLGKGDKQTISNALLLPIADLLNKSRVLRVLPYGDEMRSQTDVHLLPYKGAALWEANIDVVYAVDLPQQEKPASYSSDKSALLLLDPQEKFFEIRNVANEVTTAFNDKVWKTLVQIGGEDTHSSSKNRQVTPAVAIGPQLRAALESVGIFLYMGHAVANRTVGWTNSLKTAREAGLLVTDILFLNRAPAWGVLLGCQTAQSSEETGGQEGLGIAQSFVVRGSVVVISTARDVEVTSAVHVVRALIRHGLTADQPNLVDALRRAIADVRRQQPQLSEAELGAFRVIVP